MVVIISIGGCDHRSRLETRTVRVRQWVFKISLIKRKAGCFLPGSELEYGSTGEECDSYKLCKTLYWKV